MSRGAYDIVQLCDSSSAPSQVPSPPQPPRTSTSSYAPPAAALTPLAAAARSTLGPLRSLLRSYSCLERGSRSTFAIKTEYMLTQQPQDANREPSKAGEQSRVLASHLVRRQQAGKGGVALWRGARRVRVQLLGSLLGHQSCG